LNNALTNDVFEFELKGIGEEPLAEVINIKLALYKI